MEIEIVEPKHYCDKCKKHFGRTNCMYQGIELWVGCDCLPHDKMLFVDINKLKIEGVITGIKTNNTSEGKRD